MDGMPPQMASQGMVGDPMQAAGAAPGVPENPKAQFDKECDELKPLMNAWCAGGICACLMSCFACGCTCCNCCLCFPMVNYYCTVKRLPETKDGDKEVGCCLGSCNNSKVFGQMKTVRICLILFLLIWVGTLFWMSGGLLNYMFAYERCDHTGRKACNACIDGWPFFIKGRQYVGRRDQSAGYEENPEARRVRMLSEGDSFQERPVPGSSDAVSNKIMGGVMSSMSVAAQLPLSLGLIDKEYLIDKFDLDLMFDMKSADQTLLKAQKRYLSNEMEDKAALKPKRPVARSLGTHPGTSPGEGGWTHADGKKCTDNKAYSTETSSFEKFKDQNDRDCDFYNRDMGTTSVCEEDTSGVWAKLHCCSCGGGTNTTSSAGSYGSGWAMSVDCDMDADDEECKYPDEATETDIWYAVQSTVACRYGNGPHNSSSMNTMSLIKATVSAECSSGCDDTYYKYTYESGSPPQYWGHGEFKADDATELCSTEKMTKCAGYVTDDPNMDGEITDDFKYGADLLWYQYKHVTGNKFVNNDPEKEDHLKWNKPVQFHVACHTVESNGDYRAWAEPSGAPNPFRWWIDYMFLAQSYADCERICDCMGGTLVPNSTKRLYGYLGFCVLLASFGIAILAIVLMIVTHKKLDQAEATWESCKDWESKYGQNAQMQMMIAGMAGQQMQMQQQMNMQQQQMMMAGGGAGQVYGGPK